MTTLTPLFKLSIEIIYCIFDYLTSTEQLEFALSRSSIYRVFRIYYLGFYSPKWEEVQWTTDLNKKNWSTGETISITTTTKITTQQQHRTPNYSPLQPPLSPPPQTYRTTVLLGNKLYIPFLSPNLPYCYVLCLSGSTSQWIPCPLSIHLASNLLYIPLLNTAATVSNKKIYLFGGETYSGNVSNILYEINVEKMEIKVVEAEGIIPGGRCMHTIKAVAEKWLAVFGGRRIAYENNEPIYYDTKDLYLFYIPYATWIFPTTLYSTPYPRSYPACAAVDSALYIYGGQQLIFTTGSRRESDDHKELNASFSKVESAACESRRYLKDSVHDDENLWCFRIHDFRPDLSSSVMFKTSQKLGTLHSGTINDATATTSINSNFPASEQPSHAHSSVPFWEKHISPRANSFFSGRRQEWVMTRGKSVGRCCGAAMVGTAKKLILFGGWDKDRWNLEENTYEAKKKWPDSFISGSEFANRSSDSKEINNGSLENTGSLRNMQSRELSQSSHQALQYSRMNQSLYFTQHQSQSQPTSHLCLPLFNDSSPKGTYNTTRPWEFLRIYLLERNYWIHLRVKDLPEMECVAFLSDNSTHSNGLFVVGRTRDASNRIIMGWIKDE